MTCRECGSCLEEEGYCIICMDRGPRNKKIERKPSTTRSMG